MKLEKINSYRKLDKIVVNIVEHKENPVMASEVNQELHNRYDPCQLYISNKSLGARLARNPNIRVIPGKYNRYAARR